MKDFFGLREQLLLEKDFPLRFKRDTPSKQFRRYIAFSALHRLGIKDPKTMTRKQEDEIHNFMEKDPQQKGLRSWDRDILGDYTYEVILQMKKTGYKGLLRKGDM